MPSAEGARPSSRRALCIIFVASFALTSMRPDLLEEEVSGWVLAAKLTATGLVIAGLAVIRLRGGDSLGRASLQVKRAPLPRPLWP